MVTWKTVQFNGLIEIIDQSEAAIRAFPLMSMAHDPHTSSSNSNRSDTRSRFPARVTGLAAISISDEITFIPGARPIQTLSRNDWKWGCFRRLNFLRRTDLLLILVWSLGG